MSKESLCVVAATRGAEIRVRVTSPYGIDYAGRLLPIEDGWFLATGTPPDKREFLTRALRRAGIKTSRRRGVNYDHVRRVHLTPEDAEILANLGWVEPVALGEAIDGLRRAAA